MGNVGNIEKVMVFGILAIIVAILGIAMWGSNEIDDPAFGGPDLGTTVLNATTPGDESLRVPGDGGFPSTVVVVDQESLDRTSGASIANEIPVIEGTGVLPPPKPDPVAVLPAVETERERVKPDAVPAFHVVASGDTLEKISLKHYGTAKMIQEIRKANEDVDPRRLRIGQKLVLPPLPAAASVAPAAAKPDVGLPPVVIADAPARDGAAKARTLDERRYTVKKGDTLYGIAREIYADMKKWNDIYEANRDVIPDKNALVVGTVLRLP